MRTKVSYYPGCSLEGTARDYDASIRWVAGRLNVDLEELRDWNCCGATAAHSVSHDLALNLAARNLKLAAQAGYDVVVPCSLCFNRLKVAEKEQMADRGRAGGISGNGVKVWDLLEFFTQGEMLASFQDKVVKPLEGLKAVEYYGCLATRPPRITDKKVVENPQNLAVLLDVLGAESLDWSYKTDCCGAGLAIARPDIIDTLVQRLYDQALAAGAECIVVSCPMCQANLDLPQGRISRAQGRDYYLPVFYFTELMGLALGNQEVSKWLGQHLVDPRPLLRGKGLL